MRGNGGQEEHAITMAPMLLESGTGTSVGRDPRDLKRLPPENGAEFAPQEKLSNGAAVP